METQGSWLFWESNWEHKDADAILVYFRAILSYFGALKGNYKALKRLMRPLIAI